MAASENFAPSFAAVKNRTLASQPETDLNSDKNKEKWLDWSEDRLKEAQRYVDLADSETKNRGIRRALNQVATELVMFHGFVETDKMENSLKSLERMRAAAEKAFEETCQLP